MTTFPVVHFTYTRSDPVAPRTGRPYTVIWDGTCKTCARLVRLLNRWDADDLIETVPSQDTRVLARFPWIPAEAYAEAVQLVGPGGRTWQGAAAIDKLLEVLPYGGTLGWAFRLPGAGPLLDRFYRWFARNRYRFGCGEHCTTRAVHLDFGES